MSVKLRLKEYSSGRKSYYLDIYHNRKRSYEFLEIHIEKNDRERKAKKLLAEEIRAKRELQLSADNYEMTPKDRRRQSIIKFYSSHYDNYQKRDKRIVKYSFEKFKDFVGSKDVKASDVTVKLVEGFKDYLQSEDAGLTGETPNNYFARFKRMLKEGYKDGLFTKGQYFDISDISMPRRNNSQLRKQVLSTEELSKFAKAQTEAPEIKRAFLFACYTGLGEAEIKKLTWRRIHDNKLIIYREKTGEQIVNDLPSTAIKLLGKRGNTDGLIFDLPSSTAINKALKRMASKADIDKNISFYCGRHTFAVQLLKAGTNLKTVADCLGHTTTKHTMKYLTFVDELKTKAILNLPDIEL